MLLDAATGALPEVGPPFAVGEQLAEGGRECVGVAPRNDDPGVSDHVLDAVRIRPYHGQAARHRLERRHRQTLVPRRERVDVCRGQDRSHPRAILNPFVEHVDAARSAHPARDLAGVFTRADEDQVRPVLAAERRPCVEEDVEALALELHLPVPRDDECRARDPELGADTRPALPSPQLDVDRVGDVRELALGDGVRPPDALELAPRSDDEPGTRANRSRTDRPLESADLVVGPLERAEDGHVCAAADGDADVEARVLVFLAEERVAALVPEKRAKRSRRRSEVRRDVRGQRTTDGARVTPPVQPPVEPARAKGGVDSRGREQAELGAGRGVRRLDRGVDPRRRADDQRAHAGGCEGGRVPEHPAADELLPQLVERDAEPVEEVDEDVSPGKQRDGRGECPTVSDVTCHVPTQSDNVDSVAAHPTISSADDVRAIRRSRRRPAITQFDYLHLTALTDGLRDAIAELPRPIDDVLDVWCGSRPYDDLLPGGARTTGLDVEDNPYGVADVVSNDVLPFSDGSFDLVMCVQSFHYMDDPARAVTEIARVLRPGGSALVSSVVGFEYDRRNFEARYTEHELHALFAGWDDVRVREDGGRTVTWTVLTGSLVNGLEQRVAAQPAGRVLRPAFLASYALVNVAGLVLGRLEPRAGTSALPMNLTLTARKPAIA